MQLLRWLQARNHSRGKGLVLGMLNLGMAFACAITFFGVLGATLALSQWLWSYTGNPRAMVPFPLPVLFLLYVVAFVLMWTRFARGLQPRSKSQAIRTGLLGATPLFGLSLLGYSSVAWTAATGDFGPDSMLAATVWVYGILSTLILLAGVACTIITALFSPRLDH